MNLVCFSLSDPLGAGGFEVQLRGLIRALKPRGVQFACVTVALPAERENRLTAMQESGLFPLGCNVVAWQPRGYGLGAKVKFWLHGSPSRVLASADPQVCAGFQSALRDAVQGNQADVIHCLGLRTAYYLPDKPDAPVLLDLVDSMTLRKERELGVEHNIRRRAARWVDVVKTQKLERDVIRRCGRGPIAVVNPSDADRLRKLGSETTPRVVPFGVPFDPNTTAVRPEGDRPPVVGFWGFLEGLYNAMALHQLVHDIWPLVRQRVAGAELRITGFNIPNEVRGWNARENGLTVLESVPNVGEFMAGLTATCWPFPCGGGVKTKVLECMAVGLPVVTTPIGVEWMPDPAAAGVAVGRTPTELADHLCRFLTDPAARARAADLGRARIRASHSWEAKADVFMELYAAARAAA